MQFTIDQHSEKITFVESELVRMLDRELKDAKGTVKYIKTRLRPPRIKFTYYLEGHSFTSEIDLALLKRYSVNQLVEMHLRFIKGGINQITRLSRSNNSTA